MLSQSNTIGMLRDVTNAGVCLMRELPLAHGINIAGGSYSSFALSDESIQNLESDICGRLRIVVEEVTKVLLWEAHVYPRLINFTAKVVQTNSVITPILPSMLFWVFVTRKDKKFFSPPILGNS